MKTTIEISDALLREARSIAAREGTTLRALVERGLHRVIDESSHQEPFKLRRRSFRGNGLQPGFQGASWEKLRGAIYDDEDHGA
jgi:Bacterial antitoxin of type II TA system, VapB